MNIKWQPILISITLLLIGFTLGVLANRTYVRYRLHSFGKENIRNEFQQKFFKGITLNENQKESIDQVMDEHLEKMDALRKAFHQKVDSLYIVLKPILTSEQYKKLEERRKKMKGRMKKRRKEGNLRPPAP